MLPSGQLTLFAPQPDFRFPQILWILVFLPIAVNGKGLEANVQPNHGVDTGLGFNLHFAEDGHKILSAGRTANGGIANLTFDITALTVWHPSQTRQLDSLVGNMDAFCIGCRVALIVIAFARDTLPPPKEAGASCSTALLG